MKTSKKDAAKPVSIKNTNKIQMSYRTNNFCMPARKRECGNKGSVEERSQSRLYKKKALSCVTALSASINDGACGRASRDNRGLPIFKLLVVNMGGYIGVNELKFKLDCGRDLELCKEEQCQFQNAFLIKNNSI